MGIFWNWNSWCNYISGHEGKELKKSIELTLMRRKCIGKLLKKFPIKVMIFSKGSVETTEKRYISTKEAAELLGLSPRRIVGLCNTSAFDGAVQEGRNWKIPKDSVIKYGGISTSADNENKILPCAIGNTSYMEVVKNSYYVDKTLLIRDLIDDQAPVILLKRSILLDCRRMN